MITASLGLSLAFAEVGLRLFWDGFYVKDLEHYARPHPTRGWANRPDVWRDASGSVTCPKVTGSRGT